MPDLERSLEQIAQDVHKISKNIDLVLCFIAGVLLYLFIKAV